MPIQTGRNLATNIDIWEEKGYVSSQAHKALLQIATKAELLRCEALELCGLSSGIWPRASKRVKERERERERICHLSATSRPDHETSQLACRQNGEETSQHQSDEVCDTPNHFCSTFI